VIISSKLIQLVHDKKITAGAFATFACLQLWAGGKKQACPNRQGMAGATGLTVRIVREHLRQLEVAGVIARRQEIKESAKTGPSTAHIVEIADEYLTTHRSE
jgi:hypothetical protein